MSKFSAALLAAAILASTGCAVQKDPPSSTQGPRPSILEKGPEVYGIILGAPLNVGECAKYTILGQTQYKIANGAPCFQSLPASPLAADRLALQGSVLISFPPGAYPAQSSSGHISAIMVGGRIEGVIVSTNGYRAQDQIFEELKAKYGQPSEASKVPLSGAGSTFSGGQNAHWKLLDLDVFFIGVMGGADKGFLRIATPRGVAEHESRLKSLGRLRAPL